MELEVMCFLRVCMLILCPVCMVYMHVCMHIDRGENKGLLLKVDVFISLYPAY